MSSPTVQEDSALLGQKKRSRYRCICIAVTLTIIGIFVVTLTAILIYDSKKDDYSPTHKDPLPEDTIPPHIILIVADDLGFNDVGYQGSEINTPVIDELASSGVKLENYYTHHLCTPSRTALLSGYYASNVGLQHGGINPNQPSGLPLMIETFPETLKTAGYATHMVGKWHLGFFANEYLPNRRGFDTFLGFVAGDEDYYTKIQCSSYAGKESEWHYCGRDLYNNTADSIHIVTDNDTVSTYSTHLYTDEAVRLIESHNQSQPMFMYVAYQTPHTPLEVPDQYLEQYSWLNVTSRKIYAGMVSCMDEGIGNITAALKDTGMWDNTLIIFVSDNGAITEGDNAGGSVWPLSGEKGTMWEGGLRVPSLMSGNVIPEGKRGSSSGVLMHISDWAPTLIQLAGMDPAQVDGYPMWETLIIDAQSDRNEVFHTYDPIWMADKDYEPSIYSEIVNVTVTSALRMNQWKIMTGDPGFCQRMPPVYLWKDHPPQGRQCNSSILVWLFNLDEDPYELNNLVEDQPEVALTMIKRLAEYQNEAKYPYYPRADFMANPTFYNHQWVPWTSSPWVDMYNSSEHLKEEFLSNDTQSL